MKQTRNQSWQNYEGMLICLQSKIAWNVRYFIYQTKSPGWYPVSKLLDMHDDNMLPYVTRQTLSEQPVQAKHSRILRCKTQHGTTIFDNSRTEQFDNNVRWISVDERTVRTIRPELTSESTQSVLQDPSQCSCNYFFRKISESYLLKSVTKKSPESKKYGNLMQMKCDRY